MSDRQRNGELVLVLISNFKSYKDGFVWQDLCEDDFIYPAYGQEHVLKGSEILSLFSSSPSFQDSASSSSSSASLEIPKSSDSELRRRKKSPWSSVDISCEYKVYKSELIVDVSTLESLINAVGRLVAVDQMISSERTPFPVGYIK